MTDQPMPESQSIPVARPATIANGYPALTTRVSLTFPFAQLCPVSGEPQPGSTITIRYHAGALLLETKALRHYLASFAGYNVHGVRDLEEAAQVIAQECATLLSTNVHIHAEYYLNIGKMDVEVEAVPSTEA